MPKWASYWPLDKVFDSEEEENEDEIDLTDNYDLRDDWIQHQKYLKYMESASFLWDQFTSGNALQKNMKKKE